MPIDKFGRHLLTSRAVPYSSPIISTPAPLVNSSATSSPFYICEPSSHHSKCVLTIRGHSIPRRSTVYFILENNTTDYTFPISGKIENIIISPSTAELSRRAGPSFQASKLIGETLAKGELFRFISLKQTEPLYVEIVLQCPIAKDG